MAAVDDLSLKFLPSRLLTVLPCRLPCAHAPAGHFYTLTACLYMRGGPSAPLGTNRSVVVERDLGGLGHHVDLLEVGAVELDAPPRRP